jgi:chromosome segregation ATPase
MSSLLDQFASAAIGAAVALGGAIGKAWYDGRQKRAETRAATVDTAAAAARSAEVTGQYEVRKAEIASASTVLAQVQIRVTELERKIDADRQRCDAEMASLEERLALKDIRIRDLERTVEELTQRATDQDEKIRQMRAALDAGPTT